MQTLTIGYRRTIVQKIFRLLTAGDSCSIIGVSGMAKSNLYRFMLQPEVRQHYLQDGWSDYVFVGVDAHALGRLSERSTYDLLLQRLAAQFREWPMENEQRMAEQLLQRASSSEDVEVWQGALRQVLHDLFAAQERRRVVLLFDQFDEVFEELSPRFFANLRSLRDDHKYRISYVTFTRDELPAIHSQGEYEEFYELLSANTFGLGPYENDDAWGLLTGVGTRYGLTIERRLGDRLISIAGGHPGLLKAAMIATCIRGEGTLPEKQDDAIALLLRESDVNTECSKLLGSLRQDEREALQTLSLGRRLPSQDPDLLRRLRLKGLIAGDEQALSVFCPLLGKYLSGSRALDQPVQPAVTRPVFIDAAGDVWVEGEKLDPTLGPLEYSLLSYLYAKAGKLCKRDEVIQALYPDVEPGAVSDDAVNSVVDRLRKRIERGRRPPKYVITVRGLGYRLDVP